MGITIFTKIIISPITRYDETAGRQFVDRLMITWTKRMKEGRKEGRKKGNVLFNDALNKFYLQLYGVGHMVKDHSDNERGNPLPPHWLLFPICSKGSFICIIPQTG